MPGIRIHDVTALDAYALRTSAWYALDRELIGASDAHERLWNLATTLVRDDLAANGGTGYASDFMAVITIALHNQRSGVHLLNALRELGALIEKPEEEDDAGAED